MNNSNFLPIYLSSRKARLYCTQHVASNSPDLNPLDNEVWAVMRRRVYQGQIHSVDELKPRLVDVWYGFEQSIFDEEEEDKSACSC